MTPLGGRDLLPAPAAYAVLLRSYPGSWRRDGRVDELLGVLLDAADAEGRLRPTLAECVDIVGHGIRARARVVDLAVPAATRDRIGQVALAIGTALAGLLFLFGEVRISGISDALPPSVLDKVMPEHWGSFLTLGAAIYLTWFAAMAAYLLGHTRACRELAVVALALTLCTPYLAQLTDQQRPPGGVLAGLAALSAGVSLLSRSRSAWRVRACTAVATSVVFSALVIWRLHTTATYGAADLGMRTSRLGFYWDSTGWGVQVGRGVAQVAEMGVVVCLVGALIAWRWDRTWLPAVVSATVPVALLRLGTQSFAPDHAVRDAVICTCVSIVVIACQGVVGMRRPFRPSSAMQHR